MAVSMTYDIGYYGKVTVGGTAVLATGGSVSVQYSPIFTTGIWGASVTNVTQKVAYAPNYVSLSANINYQLTGTLASQLESVAFTARQSGKALTIYPNGIAGYSGTAYCISAGLSTSQDSLVTGELGFKTGSVSSNITTTSNKSGAGSSNLNSSVPNYQDVYPYWASAVYIGAGSTSRTLPSVPSSMVSGGVTDWNASYSSDLVLTGCCKGVSSMKQATYCALAPMDASGSFTVIGISGYLTAQNIQEHHTCGMRMATANGGYNSSVAFAQIVWTGVSLDVQSGTSMVSTNCNFAGLGNQQKAPMAFTA